MLYEHLGARPRIHDTAVVAPTAVISGDVELGPGCQVLHGAVITAEGGPITLGAHVIVMENALIRATAANAVHIGAHTLVGTLASIAGATVGEEVFFASGARVFNGALVGDRCEVRVNAIVHRRAVLPSGTVVPIGWAAIRCSYSHPTGTPRSRRPSPSSTSPDTSSASIGTLPTSWSSSRSATAAPSRGTPTTVRSDPHPSNRPNGRISAGFGTIQAIRTGQMTPWASIAAATRSKPAMLAPAT